MPERKRKKCASDEARDAPASKKNTASSHSSPPDGEDQKPLQLVPFDHEGSSGLPDNLVDLFILLPRRPRRRVVPTIQDYWETATHRAIHPIRKLMTRDRFLRLYRRFSTWDATDNIPSVYDGIKSWISSTKPSTSINGESDNNNTGTDPGASAIPEPTPDLGIPLFVGAYTKKGELNGIMDIGNQLRAQFQPQRIKKCSGKIPTFAFFFFFDIALTNTFFVQRRDWSAPTKVDSKPKFRGELYAQLVDRFSLHVTLLRTRGAATTDTLQQPHRKVRLEKRGYCAFCSAKKLNKAKVGGQLQPTRGGNVQQHKVTTGCSACGIALCNNSWRSCWEAWHKDLEG